MGDNRTILNNQPVQTLIRLGGVPMGPTNKRIELNLIMWNKGWLEAQFKNFLFKFIQGQLYFNDRMQHIDGRSPACTQCRLKLENEINLENLDRLDQAVINRYRQLPVETLLHAFVECRQVEVLYTELSNLYNWEGLVPGQKLWGKEGRNLIETTINILMGQRLKY